jgi:hypothetical protein
MSKSNTSENAVLAAMYAGTAIPWAANTDLWAALYTSDPGEAGSANTNECAFGGYARVAVDRATEFTVSGNTVENTVQISFPECTSGTETVTHCAFVTTASGAGTILHSGALSASRSVSSGITLQFPAGTFVVTED